MDESTFWTIVEQAHDQSGGDMDIKCAAIRSAVAALPKGEAAGFSRWFDMMMDSAYTWSLWAAAYIINGGCSDDTFSDFRASLISRGHTAFENALASPDSLADDDFDAQAWFYEGYHYAIMDGVELATGMVPNRETPMPENPSGEQWTEETVSDLMPKLAAKFG